MMQGLAVPDANVLLDLYRYRTQTRDDFLSALKSVRSLWVPHQVIDEFWRNRLATIRGSRKATDGTIEKLKSRAANLIEVINEWANTRGADIATQGNLVGVIDSAVNTVSERLVQISESESAGVPETTYDDPVVCALNDLLRGRVGRPFEPEDLARYHAEASDRIQKRVPPGFADDKDKSRTAHGDYFVWAQILEEAAKGKCNVLFITRDKKEDWWRFSSSREMLGPRKELIRELMLRTEGKGRLFFLTPERFLGWAKDLFGVKVRGESFIDMERVETQESRKWVTRWADGELEKFDGLLDQSDDRVAIEQLPEGSAGDTYFDVIHRMCALVGDVEMEFDTFIESFQEQFPNISLASEAKRRASCLAKLRLAERVDKKISLTSTGADFVSNPNIATVQSLFLDNVKGGRELLSACLENGGASPVRAKLKSEVPPGLTLNQATLILRWLEQLQLAD